jgi:sarcosine oxidase subunit beta
MSAEAAIPDGPVVIIGGGVVGCSLAFHLAKYGHDAVTVVEAGLLGEGTTAKATGGIRQQFSSRLNADLCREAVEYFADFEERVGEPFAFRQHGYLFLLGTTTQREQFERDVAMQQSLNIDVRLISNDDINDLVPGIRTQNLHGAAYTPEDGSGSPVDATAAFARQARKRGATVLQKTRVTEVERSASGAVTAVRTADGGRLEATVVVNATGPAAAPVGRLVGLELPVEPHPRQAFAIAPMPHLHPTMPLTVDLASGAYVHPETHGGIVGGNDRDVPASDEAKVRWNLSEGVITSLIERIPWMEHAQITSGWCGLREMTPDDHAIVGPCEVEGWWNLVGFSGHGFMQAPVVGDHVARWMVGLEDRRDLTALALQRFAAGDLHHESTVF